MIGCFCTESITATLTTFKVSGLMLVFAAGEAWLQKKDFHGFHESADNTLYFGTVSIMFSNF